MKVDEALRARGSGVHRDISDNPIALRRAADAPLVRQTPVVKRLVSAPKAPGVLVAADLDADQFGAAGHPKRPPDFRLFAPVKHHCIMRARRAGVFTKAVPAVTVDARINDKRSAAEPQFVTEQ